MTQILLCVTLWYYQSNSCEVKLIVMNLMEIIKVTIVNPCTLLMVMSWLMMVHRSRTELKSVLERCTREIYSIYTWQLTYEAHARWSTAQPDDSVMEYWCMLDWTYYFCACYAFIEVWHVALKSKMLRADILSPQMHLRVEVTRWYPTAYDKHDALVSCECTQISRPFRLGWRDTFSVDQNVCAWT